MTQTPAGWYDDGSGRQRYWDGVVWTEHFADTYGTPAVPAQQPGFGPAQTYAMPSSNDGREGLGYAIPGASSPDALADPFAAPPRQQSNSAAASGSRKGMPGWAIALIIGGVVLVVGAIVAAIVVGARASDQFFDDFSEGFEQGFNEEWDTSSEPFVPYDLESAYWELEAALRNESCTELTAVTTQNYRDMAAIDSDTCAGAFTMNLEGSDFYGYLEEGEIDGDTASMLVYEDWLEGEAYGSHYAAYTLVVVDGDWVFDTVTYGNSPSEVGYDNSAY